MVILRPLRKLSRVLPASSEPLASSDTALGDWYVNRLVVDKQPLLLLLSAKSLLSIVTRARTVRTLPLRLSELVRGRLQRLGLAANLVECEVAAMTPVTVGRTTDRSVLGTMVDFTRLIPNYLDVGAWDDDTLTAVAARLEETPCHATRPLDDVLLPDQAVRRLLVAKWGTG